MKSSPLESESPPRPSGRSIPIVGVGASAGGLEAFTQLLAALPEHTGMAFVLVQHLEPTHDSLLSGILSKATRMPVVEVEDGMAIAADRVYVIPSNANMALAQGVLRLSPRVESKGAHLSIDFFLGSLAQDRGRHAIGVVLSGTGSDGTLGLAEIKAAGGITFAQDGESAKFPEMPLSAVAAGFVDIVLPPGEIAGELARIGLHPYLEAAPAEDTEQAFPDPDGVFPRIIQLLRGFSGVDFTHYRDSTLKRRILRRMALGRKDTLTDYVRGLQSDPGEIKALYQDILIHVTRFFRDPEVFRALPGAVLPEILKTKALRDPIRVWVAGCASGEEAYSLAIVITEYQDSRKERHELRIFASDIGESPALERARAGLYPENIEQDVSPERLRRFFTKEAGGYRIIKELREMVLFARHDIAADPPFARIDLISCRNVLIYFSGPLQRRILPSFHYALNPGGFLLLGNSESVGKDTDLFSPVNAQFRIYVKKAASLRLPNLVTKGKAPVLPGRMKGRERIPATALDFQHAADRLVLRTFVPPGVLVNKDLDVLQFRGRTSPFLAPPQGGMGLNLAVMAQEDLAMEIRAAIDESLAKDSPIRKSGVRMLDGRQVLRVDLSILPIHIPDSAESCFLVLFEKADAPALPPEAPAHRAAAGTALDEEVALLRIGLAASREYAQAIRERCESVHEELKAANEELESTNEELQSANEELETAQEELQSANEELASTNEELRTRNGELVQAQHRLLETGDYARAIVDTVREPLLILDGDLRIRSANKSFYRLFGAEPGATEGRLLQQLDGAGRWQTPEMLSLLRIPPESGGSFEDFEAALDLPAGRRTLRLNARRLLPEDGRSRMTLLAMEDITERKRAEEAVHQAEEKLRQAQRMEAIGKLAGGVAHDFNNLLTAINGYSALGLAQTTPESGLHGFLEEINKAGERAAALTRQLLAYGGKQVLTPQALDLNSAVVNIHKMLTRLVGDHIRLSLSLDETLGMVKADAGQMEQVLVNLVINARDAVPDGGEITLKTRNAEVDGKGGPGSVPSIPPGRYVVLSVQDNGTGMDAEVQKHIFDPFYTTKGVGADPKGRTGTGLGLSVVQGIVTQSGGHIVVESSPGKGSEFAIYLPRMPAAARPAVLPDRGSHASPRGTETVLVVEDEVTVRNFTRKILEMQGYQVLEAHDGESARLVDEKHKDREIHLLLTDMVMPGIGGREVARRFLAARPESRVLFMSGYTEDKMFGPDGARQEAECFIPKPFTPAGLAQAVRAALDLSPAVPQGSSQA